jgi:ribosomal-protein-serine acetyltransferase
MSLFHLEVAPGVELRQFEMRDAETLFAVADRNRAYLREWLPWVDRTHSSAEIRDYIASRLEQFEANQGPNAAICFAGEIVGAIGCHPIDWANRHCSIGYWLDAAQQGKGLMTRCSAALIDYLFEDVGLHRVTIQCGTGNRRSCAIPERLGFTREGLLREAEWVNDRWVDLVVWGMLARDWRCRPTPAARP